MGMHTSANKFKEAGQNKQRRRPCIKCLTLEKNGHAIIIPTHS